MQWETFHHPDISLPVLRRRIGDEVLDLLLGLGGAAMTRGWSLLDSSPAESQAYNSATYRLRKAGLIAKQGDAYQKPVFQLTSVADTRLASIHKPKKRWNMKWSRRWYLLVYDVPESERKYRNTLRTFLQRMRMGCLQKSTWITPWDIRPEYADLALSADIERFSHLFEARTVLGRSAEEIVRTAWNMDRLAEIQNWYCKVFKANLKKLKQVCGHRAEVMQLAREEMGAFRYAMAEDPLLPRALWPDDYHGESVFGLHQSILREARKRLILG